MKFLLLYLLLLAFAAPPLSWCFMCIRILLHNPSTSSKSRCCSIASLQHGKHGHSTATAIATATAGTIPLSASKSASVARTEEEDFQGILMYSRNMNFIKSITESQTTIEYFQDQPILSSIDIEERCRSLRENIGLTRSSLKLYINKHPSICLDIFTTPVKSSKSVICRYLGITEVQYAASLRKIQTQTNNRAGTLFRGSFFFISSYLRSELDFDRNEICQLFINYPTFFVFSLNHICERVQLLFSKYGYSLWEIKCLIKRNARTIFYSDTHFHDLRVFFTDNLCLSPSQFCGITAKEPRLISSSLQQTIIPKYDQLLKLWKIPNEEVVKIITFAPNVLTTKSTTSVKLYNFLKHELHMSGTDITNFIVRYGGFLRVNMNTLRPKLITVAVIQLVCASFIIDEGEVVDEETTTKLSDKDIIDGVALMFQRISRKILERDAIVLTFSQQRIRERLLAVIPKLASMTMQTNANNAISLIHRVLYECDENGDVGMSVFIDRYISEIGYHHANTLVQSAAWREEVFLPIQPQYSISFNKKKFMSWLNKLDNEKIK